MKPSTARGPGLVAPRDGRPPVGEARESPEALGVVPDGSFDALEEVATSPNLCARKAGAA